MGQTLTLNQNSFAVKLVTAQINFLVISILYYPGRSILTFQFMMKHADFLF
jgi:hypothetical protein